MRSSPQARRGLTLIEVLASLVLLGVLFTGLLLGKARMTRQWSHAQDRQAAVRVADELLTQWEVEAAGVPGVPGVPASGTRDGFRWSITALPPDDLFELGYQRVRLSLEVERDATVDAARTPACEVDVVVRLAGPEFAGEADDDG